MFDVWVRTEPMAGDGDTEGSGQPVADPDAQNASSFVTETSFTDAHERAREVVDDPGAATEKRDAAEGADEQVVRCTAAEEHVVPHAFVTRT
jgi:hypothetical protein